MMYSIDFDDRYKWGSSGNNSSNRPMANIVIHGQGASSAPFYAIVDSGADYLQVDGQVAVALNLNMKSVRRHIIISANGTRSGCPLLPGVFVTLEGKKVAVDLLLGPPNTIPIIGRTAFLAAIEFGMDYQGWLYKVI